MYYILLILMRFALKQIMKKIPGEKYFAICAALFMFLLCCTPVLLLAQEKEFSFSGYADTYYSYDNDKNGAPLRQFSAIAPVRDEFRINLAQVSVKYTDKKVRGIVTVHFGDIPKYNWPQEPNEYLQYIQEANAGFSPGKNLWFDFGYFLTHIGAEGIIPINNIASSLAFVTYFEPVFQSGIKVSYDFTPETYGSVYLINGSNVLVDNNKNKSFGLQVGTRPSENLEIVYNNISGNEQPSGEKGKTRIYNNLVIKASFKKLEVLVGADYVQQEDSGLLDTTASAKVYGGLISLRYKLHSKFSIYARGEAYNDKDGMLSGILTGASGESRGLKASGMTIGVEYRPFENAYIRFETRMLESHSPIKIFTDENNNPSDSRTELIMTTGVSF